MTGLAGTAALVRFGLRRDRVRIVVWALALGLTVLGSVPAIEGAYPTADERAARAVLMRNPAAIMLAGPGFGLDDYTLGAMVANELALTLIVAVAIMAILMVVRHTRAEEESGRAELVRAAAVGRHAPAAAALLVTAIAQVVVGLMVWGSLVATGLDVADSALLAASLTATGLAFGAIALVTAQLTEHARAASGIAMALLGVAFLVRGVGDILVEGGGLVSWLSPIAWAQQTRAFAGGRWWPLLLSLGLVALGVALAAALGARRDFAAGLVPQRAGRASAGPALASPLALAVRLTWPSFVGWTAGIVVAGLTFGSLLESVVEELADNPVLGELLGSGSDVSDAVFALFVPYLVIAAAAYGVTALQRLRTEETEGRAEIVLARPVSRHLWLGSSLALAAVSSVVALVLGGLAMGAAGTASTGNASWTGSVTTASLAYVPALLLVLGVGAVLLGALPRLFALAWALVAWMTVVLVLGALLDLPEWLRWLSPIEQTPSVPQETLTATPLVVMTLGAAVLAVLALATFRRRDVPSV